MSEFDVRMQKYISNLSVMLIALMITFYVTKKFLLKYRDRLFAKFESSFAEIYNGPSRATKQKLFAPLHKLTSADWKLKNEGVIRILEIGVGNGANLKYFPKGSRLVFVDKNPAFEPLLRENLRHHSSLRLERLVHCVAEDMCDIPDDSVDAVVATLVLCSCDITRVLQEIRRVLTPGGKFFFLEHVLAQPGTKVYYLQRFLSVSRIWPTVNCGCRLDNETGKLVKVAGFTEVDLHEIEVYSEDHAVFKLIRSHVTGVATK